MTSPKQLGQGSRARVGCLWYKYLLALPWKFHSATFLVVLYDREVCTTLFVGPSGESSSSHTLHRVVETLVGLCVSHVCHRLSGHGLPIVSLGGLPHTICDKVLAQLMKSKTLTPKTLQPFLPWWVVLSRTNGQTRSETDKHSDRQTDRQTDTERRRMDGHFVHTS